MYMKPNNAGKNMSLRAQTANQKCQQNDQTQDEKKKPANLYY